MLSAMLAALVGLASASGNVSSVMVFEKGELNYVVSHSGTGPSRRRRPLSHRSLQRPLTAANCTLNGR